MNASSFITFFTCMLQQKGKCFYKGLYVTFKLAPYLKKNTVYLSSYSPLNEGHVRILTNSMLRTYAYDIDERIILRKQQSQNVINYRERVRIFLCHLIQLPKINAKSF